MTAYCVVCQMHSQGNGPIRVVGPFSTQQEAVDWAVEMRSVNRSWGYTPDVMDPPPGPPLSGSTGFNEMRTS